jgi:hypothetical protein
MFDEGIQYFVPTISYTHMYHEDRNQNRLQDKDHIHHIHQTHQTHSIVEYFDMLTRDIQRHILLYIYDLFIERFHYDAFRKSLIYACRILSTSNYIYSYYPTTMHLFSPQHRIRKGIPYAKLLIKQNSYLILNEFTKHFHKTLLERKKLTLNQKRFDSIHAYLIYVCHQYNKPVYIQLMSSYK